MRTIIGLGANLGERANTLALAREKIAKRVGELVESSKDYTTPPLVAPGKDAKQAPEYLNAVVIAETDLLPQKVMEALLSIERELGRDRSTEPSRWLPRVIDLDLLSCEELVINSPELTLPHPEIQNRRFVLEPLCEVWPDWKHPRLLRTARELLSRLD